MSVLVVERERPAPARPASPPGCSRRSPRRLRRAAAAGAQPRGARPVAGVRRRARGADGLTTGYADSGALVVAADRDDAEELRRLHAFQVELGLEASGCAAARARPEPGLSPGSAAPSTRPQDGQSTARGGCRAGRGADRRRAGSWHRHSRLPADRRTGRRAVRRPDRGRGETRADPCSWPAAPGARRASSPPRPGAPDSARSRASCSSCACAAGTAARRSADPHAALLPGQTRRRPGRDRRDPGGAGLRHRRHRRRRHRLLEAALGGAARRRRAGAGRRPRRAAARYPRQRPPSVPGVSTACCGRPATTATV